MIADGWNSGKEKMIFAEIIEMNIHCGVLTPLTGFLKFQLLSTIIAKVSSLLTCLYGGLSSECMGSARSVSASR